jgi:hypothetical protein
MFNNNGRSTLPSLEGGEEEAVAQAPTNAEMLKQLLAGIPAASS